MGDYEHQTYEEQQRWEKVRKTLFASKGQPSHFACEIWKLLALNPGTTTTDRFTLTEETLNWLKIEFLVSGNGITDIADAILAIAVFDPNSCIKWLKCLAQGIDIGEKEKRKVKEIIMKGKSAYSNGDFLPGFIMGAFKIANWLYEIVEHPTTEHGNWLEAEKPKLQTKFKKYFPELIKNTIECNHSTAEWSDKIFSKGMYDSSLGDSGKKFEGQFTTLIRSFVKDDDDESSIRQDLLEACVLEMHVIINPTWPGKILLNQLLYTVFKSWTLNERHKALRSICVEKNLKKK